MDLLMEKNLTLDELNKVEQKFEVLIKSHPNLLGEFQHYHIDKNGKPHFHIRGYFNKGVHIPSESVTLDEYKDKEGKRLSEKEKAEIIYQINLIEKLKKRLQLIQEQKTNLIFGEDFFNRKKIETKRDENYSNFNNELTTAHNLLIRQRNRIKTLEQGITKSELEKIIDKSCRKKNGKINYSALGKILGYSHHTAQKRCKFFEIS